MKRFGGYFTVEAALILPMVFSVLIMAVSLFVFQYDRCLLEQDAGLLMLRGTTLNTQSEEEWEMQMKSVLHGISNGKYVDWKTTELQAVLQGKKVMVRAAGSSSSPLPEWDLLGLGSMRETEYECKGTICSPVTILRLKRKMKGILAK